MSAAGSQGWWASLGDHTLRHPRRVALLLLALTAAAVCALPGVEIAAGLTRLLPPDHPLVRLASLLDQQAQAARTLWVILHQDRVVDAVPRAAAVLRQSPLVAEVATTREELLGAALQRARLAPLWFVPDDALDRLQELLSPVGLRAAAVEARALLEEDPLGQELVRRDPLGLRLQLSAPDPARELGLLPGSPLLVLASGDRALLRVTGTADAWDGAYSTALMQDVEARLSSLPHEAFGGYAVARDEAARIRADLRSSILASVASVALFLCLSTRSLRLPLLVLAPAALAIAWAVPLGSLAFGPLPTLAVAAGAMLCGLGVDFAIHYTALYRAARLHLDHAAAVRAVHARSAPELCIDAATTAGAFLLLGATSLSGMRGLGWLLALGLALCLVTTLLLLPLLLGRGSVPADPEHSWLARLADRCSSGRAGRGVALAGIALAVGSWALVAVRGVGLVADPEALQPACVPQAALRARIEHELGMATVPVLLLHPEGKDLQPLVDGLAALRQQGRLRLWSGVEAGDAPRRQGRIAALRKAVAAWPQSARRELQAVGLAVGPLEPALAELETRLAADPPVIPASTIELAGQRFSVVIAYPTARPRGTDWQALHEAVRSACGTDVQLYGTPSLVAELERVLRADLTRVGLWTLLLTAVLVSTFHRSLRLGLLALLPATLGISWTLGLLTLLGEPLTLASFVAIPLLIGIGVDDGVHLVGHFRAGATTLGPTGTACVRTSVTTLLGFGSLAFCASPGLRGLGLVVAAGVVACLLASLLVLPPLLRGRRQSTRHVAPPPEVLM